MLDDRRVVKMTTETAQMMSDAIGINGGEPFYKKCNPNHPCTKWVARSSSNFRWALSLIQWLNVEYMTRYPGKNHGAYLKAVYTCLDQAYLIPRGPLTPFQNSSLFKDEQDVFLAYKKTMIHKWANYKREPRWTNAKRPEWAT
jgi:hypothetical protein